MNENTDKNVTPFKNLSWALFIGSTCMWTAFMTTVMQLTLKMVSVDPSGYTKSYGLVTSIGALISLIANPLGGFIGDRTRAKFGKRRTWILIGSILGSILIVLMGVSTQIWQVATIFVLLQLVYNFVVAAFTALIPDQCPEEKRGTLSGINGMTLVAGVMIGNVFVHFVWNHSQLGFYIILAAIGIIGALISVYLLKDNPAEARKDSSEAEIKDRGQIYPSFKKYPSFTWALLVKFFYALGTGGASYITIMLINRMHLSSAYVASVFSIVTMIATVLSALTSYAGGILSDKFKKQKIFMYVAALVAMFGTLMYAFSNNIIMVIVAILITNMAGGIFNAVDSALVTRVLPPDGDNGKNFGIMNVANSLPQTIVPAIAPMLLQLGNKTAMGQWPFFYVVLAIGVSLSLICLKPIPDIGKES